MLFEFFLILLLLIALMVTLLNLPTKRRYSSSQLMATLKKAQQQSKKAIQEGRIFEAIEILQKAHKQIEDIDVGYDRNKKKKKALRLIQTKLKVLNGEFSTYR
ncbi:hypothetical protein [Litoribacter populi]|uniref:hypothetical protein n=1 Tax=Litoribacter populi TaxID=2598460 RepID=UPI00117C9838|nr:hypothetical protein [Litoribacter populi]